MTRHPRVEMPAVPDGLLVAQRTLPRRASVRIVVRGETREVATGTRASSLLRQLVDRFVPIYPDRVPPSSLLREFIG